MRGPQASGLRRLERAGTAVRRLTTAEYSAVRDYRCANQHIHRGSRCPKRISQVIPVRLRGTRSSWWPSPQTKEECKRKDDDGCTEERQPQPAPTQAVMLSTPNDPVRPTRFECRINHEGRG